MHAGPAVDRLAAEAGRRHHPDPRHQEDQVSEENWGALQVQLTDADEAEIRKFVETAAVRGGRVPDDAKSQCYADTKEE